MMSKTLICKPMGNWGNQLFCFFASYYKAKKEGYQMYLINEPDHSLNNWWAEMCSGPFPEDVVVIDNYQPSKKEVVYELSPNTYTPIPSQDSLYVIGYRQNTAYWGNDKEFVKSVIKPIDGIYETILRIYRLAPMNIKEWTTVNVRRGDYVNYKDSIGLESADFYKRAIAKQAKPCMIISDDIDWCKENLPGHNYLDKEVPGYTKAAVDFWFQTMVNINIISNSTFSWWAAYLNPSLFNVVIAPKQFLRSSNEQNIYNNLNWLLIDSVWEQ